MQVRRGDHLVHDTLLQIQNAGNAIRRPLKVQFIGEEGVDEGGVQKVLKPLEWTALKLPTSVAA